MRAHPTFEYRSDENYCNISQQSEIDFYRNMLRIRHTEEKLADLYKEKEMRTPTHFGIGQEAVAVGVCASLSTEDVIYSHHRCHTHYLAKGGSLLGLVAELYGRESGCSRGRGGSVHLTDRSVGFIGSSPILGQSVALATGSALAFNMDRVSNVAVAFFGEGACDEGVIYESFNFASIKKLPVLFVCENNFYATESPLEVRQATGTDLCERAKAFKVDATKVDGNNVLAVYAAANAAIQRIRGGSGPFFLECETYRWLEHVGPMFDHEISRSYRSRDEVEAWIERCPLTRLAKRLIRQGVVNQLQLDNWLLDIELEFTKVLSVAKESAWPEANTLFENIY